jgi:hypothetical protein
MSQPPKKQRKRSLKGEAMEFVIKGEDSTVHILPPEGARVFEHIRDYTPNPNRMAFRFANLTLVYHLDTKKGFILDKDGNYLSSVDKFDLKRAIPGILGIFKALKNNKTERNVGVV